MTARFGAGGGGGSFVIEINNGSTAVDINEVIAGGGGGAGVAGAGGSGLTAPTGGNGGGYLPGAGGVNGAAGAAGSLGGGGGGGFEGGKGGATTGAGGSGTAGGSDFAGGGGDSGGSSGGFGGGGGGGYGGGGGGGGYGGGGGGGAYTGTSGGGGGGSYVNPLATNVTQDPSTNGGNGFVDITPDFPCFLRGTPILTDRGEVAVEAIAVGERVRTVLGKGFAEVIWVGRREVDCVRHAKPRKVWPVRVAAGAFGEGRPRRDLWLSPNHALYVNEVLIPVKHLINGSSIAQVQVERVTYHHIELAHHDVLLAQGLPAESFLATKDGTNYANRPGPVRLNPDFTARMWEAFACARLIVTGPELDAARALVGSFAAERAAA